MLDIKQQLSHNSRREPVMHYTRDTDSYGRAYVVEAGWQRACCAGTTGTLGLVVAT